MRRTGVVLALFLLAAAPAPGAIHTYVVAATTDKAPNGTYSAVVEASHGLSVAHGGAVAFEAYVSGSNDQWLYRWQDGKVTLVSQMAGDVLGDDLGTLAWWAPGPDNCGYSVVAAGTTAVTRTGCKSGAMAGATSSFTVMDGFVFYVGAVPDPTMMGVARWGIYKGPTLVATLPDNGFSGNAAPAALFNDGAGTLYLYNGSSFSKLVGTTPTTVVSPTSLAFYAAAPGHLLYGSNKQAYDLTPAGTVDLTQAFGRIWIGNSGDVVEHQTDALNIDRVMRLEDDGPHTILSVGSKTTDGWRVRGFYTDFATAHDDDGTTAVVVTIEKNNAVKTAVLAAIDECVKPKNVGEIPLDAQDKRDASHESAHELDDFVTRVKKAISALRADTKKHSKHKQANDDAIKQLELQLDHGGFRALAARTRTADDKQDLVDNAKCSWLDDASKTLKEAAQGKHAKEISQLGDRMLDLKKVLNGDVKPGSPEAKKLLETNLVALGERFGGDNGGKLTSKALKLYNVLTGQIAAKDLPKDFRKEVADLAKVLGGKNAGELTTQIITLVDVLRGDVDADKQYEVLKDSVSALATRIGVEGLLKTPQARAAMLGFEIGKAFADRMSVDLQLVADRELKAACLNALAEAQHVGHSWGEIDYTKKTAAFTPALASHAGWQCTIRPDTNVSGYDSHTLIEAYKPPVVKWGFKWMDEKDVWFDPNF